MQSGLTELTDSRWQFIEKIIGDKRKGLGAPRSIVNTMLFIKQGGVPRRCLDSSTPWQTVFTAIHGFERSA